MVGRLLVGFVWLNLQFSVMVGRLLVGFVWLNLQISVSWQVYFQWGLCGSIFCFLCHGWQTFSGVRVAQSLVFCVMVAIYIYIYRQTFSGVRVAESLVFCGMVGRLLVGFVCLNLQFSVSWLVAIQTYSGLRVALSLDFHDMVGRLLVGFVWLNLQISVSCQVDFQWGSCVSIFSFLCHGWQTFSGVRVAQSLVVCVMVGRLLVGFVWLNLQFSVMVDRLLVGFVWFNLQFSVSWQVDFQWGSCGSIFSFLCHGWQTFSGVRVAETLVFCVMVGRLLVGFVCLNLQFSVSWLVDFQWGSCGSIFSFLCYGRQTFSRVRVSQSLVFCAMVGRLLVGFVRLNLQFSVSGLATFSGVRVAQSLVFCVMVGRLLVGFVWLNLQFSATWFAYFQWGSCVSIFSFLRHRWETFSGVRVAQTLVFCVMVGRLSVGFVWLNLQFSASWLVDFQWGS